MIRCRQEHYNSNHYGLQTLSAHSRQNAQDLPAEFKGMGAENLKGLQLQFRAYAKPDPR